MALQGFRRWKGRVERAVGDATGDRRVEATGAEEALSGEYPDQLAVVRALGEVRQAHGDVLAEPE